MIAEAKAKAARKAAIRKEEQMLLMQDKLENVERIRRMSEYKRQQIAQKISQDDERTTKMGSLKRAIADERLKSRTRELVAKHRAREGVTIERELLPGPGEYTIKTTLNVDRGYKIGEENPKSDIEWIQYRASQIPGPGAYKDVSIKASSPTIKFSLADVPSDLELRMRRAPLTPGPDEYNPGQAFRADTPSFSMGNFRCGFFWSMCSFLLSLSLAVSVFLLPLSLSFTQSLFLDHKRTQAQDRDRVGAAPGTQAASALVVPKAG